jgi:dihydroorotase
MTDTLTITRPDDWHLHVRDGAAMAKPSCRTAAQFGRALIMPNLRPPVTTAAQAAGLPRAHPRRRAAKAWPSSR